MPLIPNRYKKDDTYIAKIEHAMDGSIILDQWYCIAPKTFCYFNSNGYYHIVKLKMFANEIRLYDFLVKHEGELKMTNKEWRFKTKEEFETFLIKNHGFQKNDQ